MPAKTVEQLFAEYLSTVAILREKCPWDREQTHESIRHSLIEEAYEVVEAIDRKDTTELRNELGDILLHVALHSVMAGEQGAFTIRDVLSGSLEKIIRRHPHIFGDLTVSSEQEVRKNWEHLKLKEGRESVIDGVPRELPSLQRAYRIQEKASKIGFDWTRKEDVWNKVEEETAEFQSAEVKGNHASIEEEFGDLLFALVNYARFLHINAEFALRSAVDKFSERFKAMEGELARRGLAPGEASLEEMDEVWNSHKRRQEP